jgi:hypothetical protein
MMLIITTAIKNEKCKMQNQIFMLLHKHLMFTFRLLLHSEFALAGKNSDGGSSRRVSPVFVSKDGLQSVRYGAYYV